jgi:hypothetical protein
MLNLVQIPHFGRGKEVNKCIKNLMGILHGGFLWLEEPISIDVELISFITGLSSMGESHVQYLDDKKKAKSLVEEMNKTYNTERGSRGILIKIINDTSTRMATNLMACKILRKFRKEEVHVGVFAVAS